MADIDHDSVSQNPPGARLARGLFASKTLWLAILVTLTGAAWWVYTIATSNPNPPSPAPAAFSAGGTAASPQSVPAPAALRYGASFVAAFLIAFVLKKVIKSVLLIAGLLVSAILALKYLGIVNYDWDSAQKQVEQGVELARVEGEKYRSVVMSYLPSGLSAGAGAIFGARRG